VPSYNFEHIPVITGDPYDYGAPSAGDYADLGTEGGAEPLPVA
jgi:hypothetical protein